MLGVKGLQLGNIFLVALFGRGGNPQATAMCRVPRPPFVLFNPTHEQRSPGLVHAKAHSLINHLGQARVLQAAASAALCSRLVWARLHLAATVAATPAAARTSRANKLGPRLVQERVVRHCSKGLSLGEGVLRSLDLSQFWVYRSDCVCRVGRIHLLEVLRGVVLSYRHVAAGKIDLDHVGLPSCLLLGAEVCLARFDLGSLGF
mmetsp:Transcript_29420/g.88119  ORF Transcript_29420/g.88119 Transcript_29420/m.88119 type:complete len:204 (-) Transcript_29420:607-1218(-)